MLQDSTSLNIDDLKLHFTGIGITCDVIEQFLINSLLHTQKQTKQKGPFEKIQVCRLTTLVSHQHSAPHFILNEEYTCSENMQTSLGYLPRFSYVNSPGLGVEGSVGSNVLGPAGGWVAETLEGSVTVDESVWIVESIIIVVVLLVCGWAVRNRTNWNDMP